MLYLRIILIAKSSIAFWTSTSSASIKIFIFSLKALEQTLSNLWITLFQESFSESFNFSNFETFLNNSELPKHVGLKTAKGISFLFFTKSIIEIFFLKHSSNSFSESKPSVEKSKTEYTFLSNILLITGIQSSSLTPPQKWSNTVALIIGVTGRWNFKANLVNEDVNFTKVLLPIIRNRKKALFSSKSLFKENASLVSENILFKSSKF